MSRARVPAIAPLCVVFAAGFLIPRASEVRPALLPWIAAGSGIAGIAAAASVRRLARTADGLALLAAGLIGAGWGSARPGDAGPPAGLPEMVVRGKAIDDGSSVRATDLSCSNEGRWHPIRGTYLVRSVEAIPSGPFIARAFLAPLNEPRMPGLADPGRGARWEGLAGRLEIKEAWDVGDGGTDRRARAREALRRRIGRSLSPRIRTLIPMLVWGDRGEVDPELVRIFRSTGTMHLVAISGLHVSLIGFLLEFLLRLVVRRPSIRVAAVLAGLAAYTWIVGPIPSVVRSSIMAACLLVAKAAGVPGGMGVAWWAALLSVVALTPGEVPATGMQLSFAATAALILRPRLGRRCDLLFSSFAATGATAGILWAHFGETAPLSIVANLIGIPAFTPALIAILWGLAWGNPASATVQAIAWGPARVFCDCWIRPLALMVPAGEATIVRISSGEATGILASLLFLGALGIARSRRSRLAAAGFAIPGATALLLTICLAPSALRARPRGDLEAITLPVGQGDATFLRSGTGRCWLFDTGPGGVDGMRGRRFLAPALRWLGVRELNGVFLSHGDEDHVGGLRGLLLARMKIDTLYVSGGTETRLSLPRSRVPPTRICLAPREWTEGGGVRMRLLWPRCETNTSGNEGSLVLRVAAPGGALLLPGDLGRDAEEELAARWDTLGADVLLAGHHGSAGSTHDAWLSRIEPRIVFISCGARNRHGHPAPTTLARLGARGIESHRTDREGILALVWRDRRLLFRGGGCGRWRGVL